MAKFTSEEKLKAYLRYLEGKAIHDSPKTIETKYNAMDSTNLYWNLTLQT